MYQISLCIYNNKSYSFQKSWHGNYQWLGKNRFPSFRLHYLAGELNNVAFTNDNGLVWMHAWVVEWQWQFAWAQQLWRAGVGCTNAEQRYPLDSYFFNLYKLKFLGSIVGSRSVVSQLFGQFYEGCIIRYPVDSLSRLRTTGPRSFVTLSFATLVIHLFNPFV